MSTVKSKKLQIGTDATSSNNFTIYQPATPDGTLRIGVGNADSPTEVGKFDSNGYVATNAPAFSAYLSADQSVSSGVITKIQFDTEEFDTNNCFDNITNYRFTPTVAGYYQINASLRSEGSSLSLAAFYIYKNGSSIFIPALDTEHSSTTHISGSTLVHCNGTSDYIEIYGRVDGSSPKFGNDNCRFSGFLARAV